MKLLDQSSDNVGVILEVNATLSRGNWIVPVERVSSSSDSSGGVAPVGVY